MNKIKKIIGEVQVSSKSASDIKQRIQNIPDFKKEIENSLNKKTTEILEMILIGGIFLSASDIHIEPEEEETKMRIRMDGILQDVISFDFKTYKQVVSRIKILSKLKLNITDRPQDGRFSVAIENQEDIEIRVSVLPAEYGESIVLRLLNPKNLISVSDLGLRQDLTNIFKKEIKRPNGMIIVTGPTGSGKTTTLYAVLKEVNKPEIKAITIEDPIEYHLGGLSQTQVDPAKGYTFASGLRSLMRQDPDIMLVGEIRDLETAEIALQASLTGHLVFSTLHTNDAAGAVARFIDIGAAPVSIAPALNMVVAQRLPRRVCKNCAEFINSPEQEEIIRRELKDVPKELLPSSFSQEKIKTPKAKGCKECNFTGYKGRIGIYEIFLVDNEMENFILKSPSIVAMRELAIKKGMILMRKDGLLKVVEGITTIEEIDRVAGEED